MRTLKDLRPGQSGRVAAIAGMDAVKRRLVDMGLTPEVDVRVMRVAPLGDPMVIEVRGYDMAIRKQDAANVTLI